MLHICQERHNFFQTLEKKKIKNLIFDLGGVIIDLDTSKTIRAFAQLSGKKDNEILTLASHSIFKQYEKGEITNDDFRKGLRELFFLDLEDHVIDKAWNAMIGELPSYRLEMLKQLRKNYNVFILSNTNHIHIEYVHRYLNNNYEVQDFSTYADMVHYSQLMGMRKPDIEIYQSVLNQNNLDAEFSLFLDDNEENLEGARRAGIQTILVTHPDEVPQLLKNAGIEY